MKAVIPMGTGGASIMYGNTVDVTLAKLRKAVNARIEGRSLLRRLAENRESQKPCSQMVNVIDGDYKKLAVISSEQGIDRDGVARLLKKRHRLLSGLTSIAIRSAS